MVGMVGTAGNDWLGNLETQVHAAVERIETLRQENRDLALRVQELETELAATPRDPAAAAQAGATAPAPAGAAADWRQERRQIRLHVERLTALLEELLAAAGSAEGAAAAAREPASAASSAEAAASTSSAATGAAASGGPDGTAGATLPGSGPGTPEPG